MAGALAATCAQSSSLRPGVLSRTSELYNLIRQSGRRRVDCRYLPVIGSVPDIPRIILSVLSTFWTFSAAISRIAASAAPGSGHVLLLAASAPAPAIGQE